jgi:hypothetical protein
VLWLSFSVSKPSNAAEARGKGGREMRGKGGKLWRWVGTGTAELVNERLESLLQQSEEEAVAVAVAAMESDEADIVRKNGEVIYVKSEGEEIIFMVAPDG